MISDPFIDLNTTTSPLFLERWLGRMAGGLLGLLLLIPLWIFLPSLGSILPRLPRYVLCVKGSDSKRSCDGETARVQAYGSIDVTLVPSEPVTAPLFVQSYLVQGDRAELWPVVLERTPRGAFRLRGLVRDLIGSSRQGSYELVFSVSAVPILRSYGQATALAHTDHAGRFLQLVRAPLQIE